MNKLYIAGFPGTLGGASTEMLHAIALLRRFGVGVSLVPLFAVDPAARAYCDSIGCVTHEYHPAVFKDRIVAAWNNGRFLCYLPEIMKAGRPRKVLWFNCMANAVHDIERKCHAAGWIDLHGFVSRYQRGTIKRILDPIRAVTEFAGYRPFFDVDNPLQCIKFQYRVPTDEFVIGRISRDDPAKFPRDTWELFDSIDTGGLKKKVLILGFGPETERVIGLPRNGASTYELLPPNAISAAEFFSRIHCLVQKPGPAGESYCRAIVEAFAAGVPVVSSPEYAIPELVTHFFNGLLGDDIRSLARCVNILAREEDRRKGIIDRASNFLETDSGDSVKCWEPWKQLLN
jgi:glycosyltransferase involved in cell wall biosynthesis